MQNILFLFPNEDTLLQTANKNLEVTMMLLFKNNPHLSIKSNEVKSFLFPGSSEDSVHHLGVESLYFLLILKEFLAFFPLSSHKIKLIIQIFVLYSFH